MKDKIFLYDLSLIIYAMNLRNYTHLNADEQKYEFKIEIPL